MSDLVKLTVNGRPVAVPKGTLLVEAARQAGIEVPVFCYHAKLKPVGACRMCLVEIEKMPRLQTACTTPVAEGMVCNSVSPNAVAGQNAVLELLLANHPLDCPVCDKGGECPLQDNAFRFGLPTSRMRESKRAKDKAFPLSDRIVLDKERCIMCYRCTRFQDEIAGDQALVALERGGDSEIGTHHGEAFDSPFSGNTIELCPVGALTSRQYRFRARPWDLQRTPSVCSGCSVGCNVSLQARDGALLRLLARDNQRIDDGWLCDRGRFQTLPPLSAPAQTAAPRRPLQPLLRLHGELRPVPLPQALQATAALLRQRAGVLCAPTLTDEAVRALADELQPAAAAAAFGFLPRAHTPWLVQGRIADLPQCRKVVLLGLDAWSELPVLALWLRKAALQGGRIVAVGPDNGLFRDTAAWLRVPRAQVADAAATLLAALAAEPGSAAAAAADPKAATATAQTGSERTAAAAAAAARQLQAPGPAAVLLHPDLARDGRMLQLAQQLAQRLGADGNGGMVGAPALGANARGAQQAAAALAAAEVEADGCDGLLLLGVEPLPPPGRARLAVAGWRPVPSRDDIDVVLPMLHPYESDGTYTNFAGDRQQLRAGGKVGRGVPDARQLIAQLAAALRQAAEAP